MNDPMNDNVLDILIYLFENFLESDTAPQPSRDVPVSYTHLTLPTT